MQNAMGNSGSLQTISHLYIIIIIVCAMCMVR